MIDLERAAVGGYVEGQRGGRGGKEGWRDGEKAEEGRCNVEENDAGKKHYEKTMDILKRKKKTDS